jgi:hypothetical protein
MKFYLQEQRFDIWKSILKWYTTTNKPPKIVANKDLKRKNKITMDFIMEGLCDSTKDKVGKCSSAKEIWDKLHNVCFYPITESEDAGIEQEVMKIKMMKKEEEVEKLEEDIVTLRFKIVKISKNIEEREMPTSSVENFEKKHSRLLENNNEEKRKSYAEVIKGRNHGHP